MTDRVIYEPWTNGWVCTKCDSVHRLNVNFCACGVNWTDPEAKQMTIRKKVVTRQGYRPFLRFFKKWHSEVVSEEWITHKQYHMEIELQERMDCPDYDPLAIKRKHKR